MAKSNGNSKSLDEGFAKMRTLIASALAARLDLQVSACLNSAYRMREFGSVTGNAVNSYAVARQMYGENGMTVYSPPMPPPIHRKVDKDERLFLNPSYEGTPKRIIGKVELETYTAEGAKQKIAYEPATSGSKFGFYRFMMPVEYEPYLEGEPYETLRFVVSAKLK